MSFFSGILQWCIGSIIAELLAQSYWHGPTRGPWQSRYAKQLKPAFPEFLVWCRIHSLSCRQKRFTIARLCIHSLSASRPYFKSKAYSTGVVARWLAHVCREQIADAGEGAGLHDKARAATIWGYVQALEVMKTSGFHYCRARPQHGGCQGDFLNQSTVSFGRIDIKSQVDLANETQTPLLGPFVPRLVRVLDKRSCALVFPGRRFYRSPCYHLSSMRYTSQGAPHF